MLFVKIKCEKYWPDNGKSVAYKEINVKTTKEYAQNGYVCRHFLVTNVCIFTVHTVYLAKKHIE